MKLKIAEGLALPINAVTEKMALLGRTGSGKTYAATKIAEEMIHAGAQIVALDPVGVWYGLRIAANGKDPGIEIPVFGGLKGDLPLEPSAGALIADLVVDRGISLICDVSQFEHDADKNRFAHDFAKRFFFRKKSSPSAVHVFLEECQEFIPENLQRGEEHMLHAFLRMWKLGRNFGIGGSLISQRPQEVNKKALNLSELVFAFQLTGTHERKALEAWTAVKGLQEDIAGTLPGLSIGEARVWSPAWLRIAETVKILPKRTFNASATPEVGARAKTRELAPIDLEKIRVDMAATIERTKAEDPKHLRAENARLKAELQKTAAPPAVVADKNVIESARLFGFEQGLAEGRKESDRLAGSWAKAQEAIDRAESIMGSAFVDVVSRRNHARPAPPQDFGGPTKRTPSLQQFVDPMEVHAPKRQPQPASDGTLTGPEQRILNAIAWLESIGNSQPEQTAVAFLAGYTIGGGGFNNPRGALRTKGLLEYLPGDRIALTYAGRQLTVFPDTPLTSAELHTKVLERLPGPERKILQPLLKAYPNAVSNEDLARESGYEAGGGGFNNPRGRLRTLGLIEYVSGKVRARDLLFLEGR